MLVNENRVAFAGLLIMVVVAPMNVDAAERDRVVRKALADPELWGPEGPSVLSYLPAWRTIGERSLSVFPNRVIGSSPLRTRADVRKAVSVMSEAMSRSLPIVNPGFALLDGARKQPLRLRTEVVPRFDDDGSIRIGWSADGAVFLPKELTIAAVERRLGSPEKVIHRSMARDQGRQPATLILYRYAGGAITYYGSAGGSIERVVLNIPILAAVLFGEIP